MWGHAEAITNAGVLGLLKFRMRFIRSMLNIPAVEHTPWADIKLPYFFEGHDTLPVIQKHHEVELIPTTYSTQ